jgi:hypothetical protein
MEETSAESEAEAPTELKGEPSEELPDKPEE